MTHGLAAPAGSGLQAAARSPLPVAPLLALLLAAGSAAASSGSVAPAGKLQQARVGHTATKLQDGRVLVVGGRGPDALTALSSVELFDPKTGAWTRAAPLSVGRSHHTATLLDDGRVLVTGGTTHVTEDGNARFVALASAEVYAPAKNSWTQVAPMKEARSGHTATRLSSGKVLVVGGAQGSRKQLASVERFDPATGAFSARRPLAHGRTEHTAVALSDGSVVVLGGRSNAERGGAGAALPIASVERFDASSGVWHAVPELSEAHQRTAVLAKENTVIVIAGQTSGMATNYVEGWRPGDADWRPYAGHLTMSLSGHTATLLPSGELLVVGGETPKEIDSPRVQRWDAKEQSWCLAGQLAVSRKLHTATPLDDGSVLVAGGVSAGLPEASAERWRPAGGRCVEPPGIALDW